MSEARSRAAEASRRRAQQEAGPVEPMSVDELTKLLEVMRGVFGTTDEQGLDYLRSLPQFDGKLPASMPKTAP